MNLSCGCVYILVARTWVCSLRTCMRCGSGVWERGDEGNVVQSLSDGERRETHKSSCWRWVCLAGCLLSGGNCYCFPPRVTTELFTLTCKGPVSGKDCWVWNLNCSENGLLQGCTDTHVRVKNFVKLLLVLIIPGFWSLWSIADILCIFSKSPSDLFKLCIVFLLMKGR